MHAAISCVHKHANCQLNENQHFHQWYIILSNNTTIKILCSYYQEQYFSPVDYGIWTCLVIKIFVLSVYWHCQIFIFITSDKDRIHFVRIVSFGTDKVCAKILSSIKTGFIHFLNIILIPAFLKKQNAD